MATSAAEMVLLIDNALAANLAGGALRSYSIGGRRVDFDIDVFKGLRKYYAGLASSDARGGAVVLGGLSDTV